MIFIGLFLFIVAVVIALNLHNNANLNKIEEYLSKSNCKNYIYAKGSYKAICENSFYEISNSFTVDIKENSKIINYGDIKDLKVKDLKVKDLKIYINNEGFEFKNSSEVNLFYNELNSRLNK